MRRGMCQLLLAGVLWACLGTACLAFTEMRITFSGYAKTSTLTNFPALVLLNTNITGFSY